MTHFPAQLSGGEQQRVAIDRAITKRPSVVLCDEPTGAFDSKTGSVVLEALQPVNQELATSTSIITHNASIAQMADRVIHLADVQISNFEINETLAFIVDKILPYRSRGNVFSGIMDSKGKSWQLLA